MEPCNRPIETRKRWRQLLKPAGWVAILIAPALANGAEPNRSWDTLVQSVTPGRSVVVTKMTSAAVEGKLLEITADSIAVRWHGSKEIIRKDDVFRVRIANLRRRHTLLGLAGGAAAGAAMGAAVGGSSSGGSAGIGAAAFALASLGVGALVGGVLPIGDPLYEAQRPPKRAVQDAR